MKFDNAGPGKDVDFICFLVYIFWLSTKIYLWFSDRIFWAIALVINFYKLNRANGVDFLFPHDPNFSFAVPGGSSLLNAYPGVPLSSGDDRRSCSPSSALAFAGGRGPRWPFGPPPAGARGVVADHWQSPAPSFPEPPSPAPVSALGALFFQRRRVALLVRLFWSGPDRIWGRIKKRIQICVTFFGAI